MKFSVKLALFFSGLFLAISAIVVFSISHFSHAIIREEIGDNLETQAFQAMDKLDRMLSNRLTHLLRLRDIVQENLWTPDSKIDADGIAKRFANFMRRNPDFLSLSLFDMDRVRLVDTLGESIGKQHGLNEYWPGIIAGKDVVFDMYHSESVRRPVFHFAFPLKDKSGHPAAVFVVRLPPEDIDDIVIQAGGAHPEDLAMIHSGHMKVDLARNDGVLVYSNYNRPGILKDTAPEWARVRQELTNGTMWDSYEINTPTSGGELVVFAHEKGYRNFAGNGWTLIARIPSGFVLASAASLTKKILVILFLNGVVSLAGVIVFSRTVSRPIEKLDIAVTQIAQGNLDTSVDVSTNDEIGRLAANFNKMTRELAHTTSLITEYTVHLEKEIAERGLAEKRQKELLEEMGAILKTAEVGIAHLVNRRPVWVNQHIERIYGYQAEEVLGMANISILYSSMEEFEEVGQEIVPVLAAGGAYHRELQMKRKDGALIWCKIVGKAVDASDLGRGVIWITEDITERRRSVHELRIAKERAEEATMLKDKFVSLVAHDLKAPLAGVYGLLKHVIDHDGGTLPDYVKQSVSRAAQSSEKMIQLTEDLLDIGMLRVGKIKPSSEVIDVWGCVIEAIVSVEQSAIKKGVRFVNLVPEESFQLADPKLLTRVVQNLLSNAVKFSKPGGAVTVFIPEGCPSTIAVKDTGVGMSAKKVTSLFEYAGTASTPGTHGEKGTGMGLPMSYEIVKIMGGNLRVESREGEGSVFFIDLQDSSLYPGAASA